MAEITTIPVKKTTRDLLKSMGIKGETYDEIIRRLIGRAEYEAFMEKQYGRLRERDQFVSLEDL
jgi:hypothetical protein